MNDKNLGIKIDDFGRPNGVLVVNKPRDITSHDVVYKVRKALGTKKVGHAGALDPFAEGLLIILVGKSTKLANSFLDFDKEYIAKVLFGVTTDTIDIEGAILETKENKITKEMVEISIEKFKPSYEQQVPIFSSVKVEGQKLRVLARKYERFEIEENKVSFYNNNELKKTVELPKKEVKIYDIELQEFRNAEADDFTNIKGKNISMESKYVAKIRVKCSKGTYIRQLAYDIGKFIKTPSMLIDLKRTLIGDYLETDAITIEEIENLLP